MDRATNELATMKHPEGKWRVDEMVKATKEANEVYQLLESERPTLEQERDTSSLADLDT